MSNVICIDNGSHTIKAGFGTENEPRVTLPNIVGTTKHASMLVSDSAHRPKRILNHKQQQTSSTSGEYIGHEAISRRATCHLSQPMIHNNGGGTVNDWHQMEQVWSHMFEQELGVHSEEHPVLLTYHQAQSSVNNARTLEHFFEMFQVPAMYIGLQSMYTLLASGRVNGLVVDMGHTMSSAIPFFEGEYLRHAKTQMEVGGRNVSAHLARLLRTSGTCGVSLDGSISDLHVVDSLKHKHVFVAENYEQEKKRAHESSVHCLSYELPDGTVVELNEERFKCAEVLFEPSKMGIEIDGIHETVILAVRRSDLDVRRHLYENIILVGGCSLMKGLEQRLQQELVQLAPANIKVQVVTPAKSEMLTWIGMSLYASFFGLTTHDRWISRDMYEEYGPEALVESKLHL